MGTKQPFPAVFLFPDVVGNSLPAVPLSQTQTNKNIKASKNEARAAFHLGDPERLPANLWIFLFSAVFWV